MAGALVWGGDDFGGPWAHEPSKGSTFEAKGYDPGEPRQMHFLHKPRRLAGSLRIEGEKPRELAVRLQPWAMIRGRILDSEDKPKEGLEIQTDPGPKPGDTSGPLPRRDKYSNSRHYTDDEGRFKIEGLVPGLKYSLGVGDWKARTYAFVVLDTVFQPGETRDVGDVRLEDIEVLRKRLGKDSE